MKKDKILMVYVLKSTFTKRDIAILNQTYEVDEFHFNTKNKLSLPFILIKQLFYLLIQSDYKFVITQSAGYLSFLPALLTKFSNTKLIIIAIGTDCAKLPEINYGAQTKPILAWFTNYSFLHANLILPVHKSLEKSTYTYVNVQFPKQGIRSFNPLIKTPIHALVNGYDTNKWKLLDLKRKQNSFLTVSFALDKVGYYRKGIDLVVKTAKTFPNYNFTIVGKVVLFEDCPPNLTLIENVPQTELLEIYNKHQYYFQLSMFEGFPNALCEAMLCGCIPIGSNVAGIPDIIGVNGYLLKRKKMDELKLIIDSLKNNVLTPSNTRDQIVNNFPLERREKELINYLKNHNYYS